MKNRKFLVLGSNGQLGREFARVLGQQGLEFTAPPEKECDLANFDGMARIIETISPTTIINCAAYNAVDDAESHSHLAHLVNAQAVENIAKICKQRGIVLVHYSTDYVFDGKKGDLYREDDEPNPLNIYGKSKLAGEVAVRETLDDALVFRTSWVYGDGTQNFIHKLLTWASTNKILRLSADEVSVPTSTRDLVECTLRALEQGLKGLYHLTNSGYASRYEWGRFALQLLEKDNILIPVPMDFFKSPAPRPTFTAMSNQLLSEKLGMKIPDWKEAVTSFLSDKTDTLR